MTETGPGATSLEMITNLHVRRIIEKVIFPMMETMNDPKSLIGQAIVVQIQRGDDTQRIINRLIDGAQDTTEWQGMEDISKEHFDDPIVQQLLYTKLMTIYKDNISPKGSELN